LEENQILSATWEMTCPGCENACHLIVHGQTCSDLRRVEGAHCGAGFTHARRALREKELKESQHREEQPC